MTTPLIRRLDGSASDFADQLDKLTERHEERDPELTTLVTGIIARVRAEGDAALLEYTQRFDLNPASTLSELALDRSQWASALERIDGDLRQALHDASDRIRVFHERQKEQSWDFEDPLGNRLGQRILPLARVGIYVPGGKASYPSSVLMNAIPAKVAGVEDVVMVVPTPEGVLNDAVLAAAAMAGVDRVFTIGGAQAVAALAYGTESVPAVDKITGPGNRFVAEAKRQVFGQVGIDMVAGPSEILIVADGSADPAWMAMDLFSQAEHDEQAQAILISPDADYLSAVYREIERLLPTMPRAEIISASLANRGALIQVADLPSAFELVNRLGPEHLELALVDPEAWINSVRVAGAIFMGSASSESLGDYCAGPNHVLPTSGTARFSSPLGVYDFQKRSSIIHCSHSGAKQLADVASTLARAESLIAHARSAELRSES